MDMCVVKNKKKVMLGMSGGVDSSVAAVVLMEMGYEVIGVTMKVWEETIESEQHNSQCCSLSAVEDARKVANQLGIPHYVINVKDSFKKTVVQDFISNYLQGRTPNPCVECNRHIKFDLILNKAKSMGIDYIATGHYARVVFDKGKNRFLLKQSATQVKDQTYVLYTLTQDQLAHSIMPLGEFTKEYVRSIAKTAGLGVANKPDSQEICFVSDNNYARFISEHAGSRIPEGYFVDIHGNKLGKHNGIIHYTIGQRKGLGLALGKPVYVVDIDANTNTVVLGDEKQIFSNSLIASQVNWISIDSLKGPMDVSAKIRYSAKECRATVYPISNSIVKVIFNTDQRAITPGQSVVFYNEDGVVGGGIILKPNNKNLN